MEEVTTVSIETFARQDILKLESPETDVAVEMGASSDSLFIVYKAKEGGWTFTSVDLSRSSGAGTYSTRKFPLPSDGEDGGTPGEERDDAEDRRHPQEGGALVPALD